MTKLTVARRARVSTGEALPVALELRAALEAGETTPSKVARECLERIASLEADVQAWASLDERYAEGTALDSETPKGVIFGLPFGAKDNIDTADLPTAHGTPIHKNNRPTRDAACVASLRLAGGVCIGKTVCTEFAHRAPGPTTNPWNTAHTPGGSSSGSAAAVASGMVPFALGTQTTGSVIRPAAYCGVVGYKPTHGEFNVSGVMANTPSFDTLGVMTRCVEDLALVRRAILDESVPVVAPADLRNVRVGLCKTPYADQADDETHALLNAAQACLERQGAIVQDFDGGGAFDGLSDANIIVSGYEFARTLGHERRTAYDDLSEVLRTGRMADGLATNYASYVNALQQIAIARARMDAALDAVDFVITPAAPGTAPVGHAATGSAVFNMAWTTLHTPTVTLPVAVGSNGLPLGLQLVAGRNQDDRLLSLAASVFAVL